MSAHNLIDARRLFALRMAPHGGHAYAKRVRPLRNLEADGAKPYDGHALTVQHTRPVVTQRVLYPEPVVLRRQGSIESARQHQQPAQHMLGDGNGLNPT